MLATVSMALEPRPPRLIPVTGIFCAVIDRDPDASALLVDAVSELFTRFVAFQCALEIDTLYDRETPIVYD